jgi:hypothetical protein
VDNTPDPEPEDVQAHLIGGVPEAEALARQSDFARFGVAADTLFQPECLGYLAFLPAIATKPAIKTTIEANPTLQKIFAAHHGALEDWWNVARDDFAKLRDGKKTKRVTTSFTSVRNEADRVGPTSPIGLTHIGSLALRAHSYARCGSGGWSSGCFLNKVEFIPHQSKGCCDEGCPVRVFRSAQGSLETQAIDPCRWKEDFGSHCSTNYSKSSMALARVCRSGLT